MHICIYIYTHPSIYIYMYKYIYMYICVCAYMHICTYVFLCSFIAIHICTHIYCRAVGHNRRRAAAGCSSEGTQQGIEWSLAAVNSSAHDIGMAVRSLSHPPWILQHTATHCNTLQHTATHCNTLQHSITSTLICTSLSLCVRERSTQSWMKPHYCFGEAMISRLLKDIALFCRI